MTVQTDEITPADKKLYALRDVTGTVASIPLITASILSKKLAEGAGTLVFDVKCGSGAFMKTPEEAASLAKSLVDGAKSAGRKAAALVTDMSAPLGFAVGNANEVAEALAILRGESERNGDIAELCIEQAAQMVSLELEKDIGEARELCRAKLADGGALAKFEAMVAAHGGDLAAFERLMEKPTFRFRIQAMKSGYVAAIDAEKVGRVALALGAGRMEKTDRIDPLAGIRLAVKRGDRVSVGMPLATLESSRCPDGLERAAADLLKAFVIAPSAPELPPLMQGLWV
jgi:pyrimidine-nucleoside phosphorylase